MKIHVWRNIDGVQCGRPSRGWQGPHVTRDSLEKATCLDCLRSVQSSGLWHMELLSAEVRAATEQLGKLTRAKARERRKQEGE